MKTYVTISARQADIILNFLKRTQLTGGEMPDYVDIFNTLSKIAGRDKDKRHTPFIDP